MNRKEHFVKNTVALVLVIPFLFAPTANAQVLDWTVTPTSGATLSSPALTNGSITFQSTSGTSQGLANGTYTFSSANLSPDYGFNCTGGGDLGAWATNPTGNQQYAWNGSTLGIGPDSGTGNSNCRTRPSFIKDNGNGTVGLNATGDTFAISASGIGYTIKDATTGLYLGLSGTTQGAPGSLTFSAVQTVWTTQSP